MPYSMEMRTRLQRSPVAQLGQIILRGLADNTSVDITSLEHLSRETDLHAVDILPLSKRYRDISIDITYYRSIRCTWLNRKNAADKGVLVYIHGGGFVVGVLGSQWRWLAEVLLRTGMAAVVIHYETFPKVRRYDEMTRQCLSAIKTIDAQGELPATWVMVGDSAGGSLVHSLLAVISNGKHLTTTPRGALLMSPWTGASDWPSFENSVLFEDDILDVRWLSWMVKQLDHQPANVDWQKLKSSGFSVLLQVGTQEVFLPGAQRLKQVLEQVGLSISYDEARGSVHAYPLFVGSEAANEAILKQSKWLLSLMN